MYTAGSNTCNVQTVQKTAEEISHFVQEKQILTTSCQHVPMTHVLQKKSSTASRRYTKHMNEMKIALYPLHNILFIGVQSAIMEAVSLAQE